MTNYLPVSRTTLHKFRKVQQTLLEKLQRQTQQQYLTDRSITALNLGYTYDAAISQIANVGGASW